MRLFVGARPQVPVREIALLVVEEESIYAGGSEARALALLRETAGRMGCDALLVLGPSGAVGSGIDGKNARTLVGVRGTCAVYEAAAP